MSGLFFNFGMLGQKASRLLNRLKRPRVSNPSEKILTLSEQIQYFIHHAWKLHAMHSNLDSLIESNSGLLNNPKTRTVKLALVGSIIFCVKATQFLLSFYLDEQEQLHQHQQEAIKGTPQDGLVQTVSINDTVETGLKEEPLNVEDIQKVIEFFLEKMHSPVLNMANAVNLLLASNGQLPADEGASVEQDFIVQILTKFNQSAIEINQGNGIIQHGVIQWVFDILKTDEIIGPLVDAENTDKLSRTLDTILENSLESDVLGLPLVSRIASEIKGEEIIREGLQMMLTESVRWSVRR